MMAIFWNKDRSVLIEYLTHKETINTPSYALFIDWLRLIIFKKCPAKVKNRIPLVHENAILHKLDVVEAVIYQAVFI
jgi:hypothetical protein